jgi:hypothetical protein
LGDATAAQVIKTIRDVRGSLNQAQLFHEDFELKPPEAASEIEAAVAGLSAIVQAAPGQAAALVLSKAGETLKLAQNYHRWLLGVTSALRAVQSDITGRISRLGTEGADAELSKEVRELYQDLASHADQLVGAIRRREARR